MFHLCVSEDTKHPGIVLDDCLVSRMCTSFSSISCVMDMPQNVSFKSQSKSEFTLYNMYSKRMRPFERAGELKRLTWKHGETDTGFSPKWVLIHKKELQSSPRRRLRSGTQNLQV